MSETQTHEESAPRILAQNATRYKAICDAYLVGNTLKEVGTAYGVSPERVRQILVLHHITERHGAGAERRALRANAKARRQEYEARIAGRWKARDEFEAPLVARYVAGERLSDIARSAGMTPQSMNRILNRAGAQRQTNRAGKPLAKTTAEQRVVIADRYFAGESIEQIAADFGLVEQYIANLSHRIYPGKRRLRACKTA